MNRSLNNNFEYSFSFYQNQLIIIIKLSSVSFLSQNESLSEKFKTQKVFLYITAVNRKIRSILLNNSDSILYGTEVVYLFR